MKPTTQPTDTKRIVKQGLAIVSLLCAMLVFPLIFYSLPLAMAAIICGALATLPGEKTWSNKVAKISVLLASIELFLILMLALVAFVVLLTVSPTPYG